MKKALLLILLALAGCNPNPPQQNLQACRIKLGNPPRLDPGWVQRHAQYDYIILSGNAWAGRQAVMDSLRLLNPDIYLGEYFHVEAIGQWIFQAVARGDRGWSRDYYDAVTPYLARTNQLDPATGLPDTAAIFMRNYCVNLTLPGATEALVKFYADRSAGLDIYMLDFLSVPLPDFRAGQGPRYLSEQAGDLDLDQDGIAHAADMDEQEALRASYVRLLKQLRVALPDFLLIPNGHLALTDDEIARLCDGVYVEGFPQWFFGTGYEGAFDPGRVPSLWSLTSDRYHRRPGLVLLEDTYYRRNLGGVAALFDGAVEVIRGDTDAPLVDATRSLRYLGPPLGPARRNGAEIMRPFQADTVRVKVVNPAMIQVNPHVQ